MRARGFASEWWLEKTRDGRPRRGRPPSERTRDIARTLKDAKPGDVIQIELKPSEQDEDGYSKFRQLARAAIKILGMRAKVIRGAMIDGRCYVVVIVLER